MFTSRSIVDGSEVRRDDLGDLGGFFSKVGKGIKKVGSVAQATPGFLGRNAVKAAFIAPKAGLAFERAAVNETASQTGGIVGGILHTPVDALKRFGGGVVKPFRGPTPQQQQQDAANAAAEYAASRSAPQQTTVIPSYSGGGGGGYASGGGGGGGGGDTGTSSSMLTDPSQAPAAPQTLAEKWAALPAAAKIGILAAVGVGGYFIVKRLRRGGRSARHSKS